jgi:hypothetical protein
MMYLRTLVLLALAAWLLAPTCQAAEVLTNDAIVSMVKARLGEELILSKIKMSTGQYDTTTSALIKLKAEGVSDKIIQAMMGAPSAGAPVAAPVPPAVPLAPPPPVPAPAPVAPPPAVSLPGARGMMMVHGLSLFVKADDRVLEVLPVVPEIAHSMKKHFIPYYFGPGDNWHLVRGQKAVVQLPKGKPSFYTKVNPSSFQLMRLTYDAPRNFRYVVSTGGTYRGSLSFITNRLADDTFELVPSGDLAAGEYAFVAGGTFYDFGIE